MARDKNSDYVHRVNETASARPIEVDDPHPWYVVWSEARAEKKVAERLAAKGFGVWLPTVTSKRRWSDRWKEVTVPLFPGYLFASTAGAGFAPLLRTPGVLTLVKDGAKPAQLAHDYVTRLRAVVNSPDAAVEPLDEPVVYAPGDAVVVEEGSLAGFQGVVAEVRGSRRLVVWIESVGRGLLCSIGAAAVRPVATLP
jgi:transcription antitermination factor NusG